MSLNRRRLKKSAARNSGTLTSVAAVLVTLFEIPCWLRALKANA